MIIFAAKGSLHVAHTPPNPTHAPVHRIASRYSKEMVLNTMLMLVYEFLCVR